MEELLSAAQTICEVNAGLDCNSKNMVELTSTGLLNAVENTFTPDDETENQPGNELPTSCAASEPNRVKRFKFTSNSDLPVKSARGNIEVCMYGFDENTPPCNVNIEFLPLADTAAYTAYYNTYENEWWCKYRRTVPTRYRQWYYLCMLCNHNFGRFQALKNHLHWHFNFYPYTCGTCRKRFRSRDNLLRHKHD